MAKKIATRTEIRIRLLEIGKTWREIAKEAGVTDEALHATVRGEIKSDKCRSAITTALGWPASRLWADAGKGDRVEQGRGAA